MGLLDDARRIADEAENADIDEVIHKQARLLGGYYKALMAEGMPEALACQLVIDMHLGMVEGAMGKFGED